MIRIHGVLGGPKRTKPIVPKTKIKYPKEKVRDDSLKELEIIIISHNEIKNEEEEEELKEPEVILEDLEEDLIEGYEVKVIKTE